MTNQTVFTLDLTEPDHSKGIYELVQMKVTQRVWWPLFQIVGRS